MALLKIEVHRKSAELIAQTLPDGSTAIFEVPTKNVYSLNATAAAAWEACASATTLSQITAAMSIRLGAPVTEDLAHEAVSELAAVGLVKVTSEQSVLTSRRAMLKQVAGVAIPVVLVLTGAEQRAHAQVAGSAPGTTSGFTTQPITTPPITTPPIITTPSLQTCASFLIQINKAVDNPDGTFVTALAGAVFKLLDSANNEIITLTTADGTNNTVAGEALATLTNLPLGNYTLVEVSAPGGPYQQPFPTHPVLVNNSCTPFIRNIHNVLVTPAG